MYKKTVFDAAERDDFEAVQMFIEQRGVSPSITRRRSIKDGPGEETLAHVAARNGNLKMLQYFIEKIPSVLMEIKNNDKDSYSAPNIFEEAVEKGALDVIKYLVENQGANVFQKTYRLFMADYTSPVHMAVYYGHLNVTKYFVEERHVNVDRPCRSDEPYCTMPALLFMAIHRKQRTVINYLIDERNADLTVLNGRKENILFGALGKDFGLDFMKYVLDEKRATIDIDWKNIDGKTLLWYAAGLRHDLDVVHYLVGQKQADINISDNKNNSLLHETVYNGNGKIIEYLVNKGADIDKKDQDGNTPLHVALRMHHNDDICKYFVEHGADVDAKNNKGETPLSIAISMDHFEPCKIMMQHGRVDVDRKNENGETLVHVAATGNKTWLLDFLVSEKHANVNTPRTKDHWTPLHCAASWDHYEICEYLIRHGANAWAEDTHGKTAAQIASDKRVIDFIANAANKTRRCRSVGHRMPALNSTPEPHEYNARLGIAAGNLRESLAVAIDRQTRFSQFQNFLILAHWFMIYVRSSGLDGRRNPTPTVVIFQDTGMNSVAEDAIAALPEFQQI